MQTFKDDSFEMVLQEPIEFDAWKRVLGGAEDVERIWYEDQYGERAAFINERYVDGAMIKDIMEIVQDCEAVQDSNESAYTKEQAKISAYDEIRAILDIGDTDGAE